MKPLTERDIQRFHGRILKGGPDECWPCTGFNTREGFVRFEYGEVFLPTTAKENAFPNRRGHRATRSKQVRISSSAILAHRLAYMLHYKRDPGHLSVKQRCGNRQCCNPAHLYLGYRGPSTKEVK